MVAIIRIYACLKIHRTVHSKKRKEKERTLLCLNFLNSGQNLNKEKALGPCVAGVEPPFKAGGSGPFW